MKTKNVDQPEFSIRCSHENTWALSHPTTCLCVSSCCEGMTVPVMPPQKKCVQHRLKSKTKQSTFWKWSSELSIQTWWISGTGSNPPQSEFLSKCCAQCNYKHDIAVDVSSTNPQIWLLCLLKLQARSWSSANIAALIFPWIPKATALILKVRRLRAAVLKLAVKRPRPFIVPATSPTQLHQLHFVILLFCLCLLCHISHFSHLGRLYKHSLEHLVPVQHSRGCGNVSTSPQV